MDQGQIFKGVSYFGASGLEIQRSDSMPCVYLQALRHMVVIALTTLQLYVYVPRYRTMVRSVRLGYNVLMTDNDVVLFDDPYHYFKSPPFSHFTVLNQMEFWGTHENNGGFIYIQNARPNGPAVWLYTEVNAPRAHTSCHPFVTPQKPLIAHSTTPHRPLTACSATRIRVGGG